MSGVFGRKARRIAELERDLERAKEYARAWRRDADGLSRRRVETPERIVHQPHADKPFAVEVDGPSIALPMASYIRAACDTRPREFDTLEAAVKFCGKQHAKRLLARTQAKLARSARTVLS